MQATDKNKQRSAISQVQSEAKMELQSPPDYQKINTGERSVRFYLNISLEALSISFITVS